MAFQFNDNRKHAELAVCHVHKQNVANRLCNLKRVKIMFILADEHKHISFFIAIFLDRHINKGWAKQV